jgi:hypothetical protein
VTKLTDERGRAVPGEKMVEAIYEGSESGGNVKSRAPPTDCARA